jgi:ankyrin repeat protein
MIAADKDHPSIEVVKDLLAKGADVNAKENIVGLTALMDAALHGNAEVVRALLAKGADVNAKTKNGRTALSFAEKIDTASELLGFDTNAQGHAEATQLLKTAGAR